MRIPINEAGYSYIAAMVVLTVMLYYAVANYLFLIPAGFACFFIFFFRDPVREIPTGKNIILAPADGKVLSIEKEAHNDAIGGPATVIKIFLSPWNVHVNRAPVSAKVMSVKQHSGHFRPAYSKGADKVNEQNRILLSAGCGKVEVVQIVGFLARRIKCFVKKNDEVRIGDKIGVIQFGSGTNLILSKTIKVSLTEGDKVRAGITIVARY
ncbi:MAG: phosphatidylserine decarboxylase [archaeon]